MAREFEVPGRPLTSPRHTHIRNSLKEAILKLIDVSTPKHPNTFTMVDDEDFNILSQTRWIARQTRKSLYVVSHRGVFMHKVILNTALQGDHIDGNRLNNQRSNLREATNAQNNRNKPKICTNTSGFIGVSWNKADKIWFAEVVKDYKRVWFAYGHDIVDLAKRRDEMARKFHGEFARFNFPELQQEIREAANK